MIRLAKPRKLIKLINVHHPINMWICVNKASNNKLSLNWEITHHLDMNHQGSVLSNEEMRHSIKVFPLLLHLIVGWMQRKDDELIHGIWGNNLQLIITSYILRPLIYN